MSEQPRDVHSTSDPTQHGLDLEEFERTDSRPPFILTYPEVKLLGIAGVSFFLLPSIYLTLFRLDFS